MQIELSDFHLPISLPGKLKAPHPGFAETLATKPAAETLTSALPLHSPKGTEQDTFLKPTVAPSIPPTPKNASSDFIAAPITPDTLPGDSPSADVIHSPEMAMAATQPSLTAQAAENIGVGLTNAQTVMGRWANSASQSLQQATESGSRIVTGLASSMSGGVSDETRKLTEKASEIAQPLAEATTNQLTQMGQASVEQVNGWVESGQAWAADTFPTPQEFVSGFTQRLQDVGNYAYGWVKQRGQDLIDCIPQSVYYPQKWPPKPTYKVEE